MKKKITWKMGIILIAVLVITVIAGVGLWKAPSKASDHLAEDLEQEFKENSRMLERQNQKNSASADSEHPEETKETSVSDDAKNKEPSEEQTSQEEAATEETEKNESITFVGDSVMLGAAPTLMEMLPESIIDAKESRQAREGLEILQGLAAEGKLGSTVVIELGINSYFSQDTGQEIIDYLGKDRKIYWVTVYGKYLPDQERINGVILNLAKENDNVEAIRWDSAGAEHPDWFYNDGIHLNGEGRKGFADALCQTVAQ